MIKRLVTFAFITLLCWVGAARAVAALLPDSGQIAYSSDLPGESDIFLLDLRTRLLINLTGTDDVDEYSPSWSPDGQRIAFGRNVGGNTVLHAMELPWRTITRLTTPEADSFAAEWSPDGTRLAYLRQPDQQIMTVELGASDERPLTFGLSPTWSPDGRQIAFSQPGFGRLMAVDLPSGDVRPLVTPENYQLLTPAWSPDGRHIAVTRVDRRTVTLVVYEADCLPDCADRYRAVSTPPIGLEDTPAWSPDSRWLVFRCTLVGYSQGELCLVSADGGMPTRLTYSLAHTHNGKPAWRP